MASLFFYKRSPEISMFDTVYFNDNEIDFDRIIELLKTSESKYNEDKVYDSEGYAQIKFDEVSKMLSCMYIFKNTLGQYTENRYDVEKEKMVTIREPYFYFGSCRVSITSDLNIIVKANYSSEESSKSKCLELLNEKGIEVRPIKLTNEVFQHIRDNYEWKKIKIQKIEIEGDSTKKVSYEIDPASDKKSDVDLMYKDSGVYEHVTFHLEFKEDKYVVKLYKERNKISIDESQFKTPEELDAFSVHLLELISDIKKAANELEEDSESKKEED
ncbi:hypothetical protein [Andreesenia angusta]|nr:hypothetical protein [Andreesenia angusta]